MLNTRNKTCYILLLLMIVTSIASSSQARLPVPVQGPNIVLWAWERPEDLRFIDIKKTGVAYLAGTVNLENNNYTLQPRMQPLAINSDSWLVAVVRLESYRKTSSPDISYDLPALSMDALVNDIVALAKQPNINMLQLDYDARLSERVFYRKLIYAIKARLPEDIPLSMTALASWCLFDNWLDELPIDEAVPMLFEMGADKQYITSLLARNIEFSSRHCRNSIGISTEEVFHNSSGKRVYVFNGKPWNAKTLETIIKEITH